MTGPGRARPFRPGVVRALLRLYPPAFRARYGREIEQLVRASCQESPNADRSTAFWASVVADLVTGAAHEHIAAAREWPRQRHRHPHARTHG